MDVREKLVDLIFDSLCRHIDKSCNLAENIADDLIRSGVTVQENVEMSDELLKQLKNAPITICKEEPSIELVQEWISVDDRLPEDDLPKDTKKKMIRCLVYTNKGTIKPCVRQRWEVNGKLVPWQWNKDLFANPTHWMYYPHPPKGE